MVGLTNRSSIVLVEGNNLVQVVGVINRHNGFVDLVTWLPLDVGEVCTQNVSVSGALRQAEVDACYVLRTASVAAVDLTDARNHGPVTVNQTQGRSQGIALNSGRHVGHGAVLADVNKEVVVGRSTAQLVNEKAVLVVVDVDVNVKVAVVVNVNHRATAALAIVEGIR